MKNITRNKYVASLSNTLLSLSIHEIVTPAPQYRLPTLAEIEAHHDEQSKKPAQKKRQKISKFSDASRRRLVKYAREIPKDRFTGFITLTYPVAPEDVGESKEHINQFLEMLRREAAPRRPVPSPQTRGDASKSPASKSPRRSNSGAPSRAAASLIAQAMKQKHKKKKPPRSRAAPFSALWVMEFQERGAVHYHIWTNKWISKTKVQKTWNRIIGIPDDELLVVPSTNVRAWRSYSKSGLASYVAKYATKQAQKELPNGIDGAGRWWGKVGDTSTPLGLKIEVTKEQFDKLKKAAIGQQWREIEHDYCRLFVIPEYDRMTLFKWLSIMKNGKGKMGTKRNDIIKGRVLHVYDGDTVSMRLENGKRVIVRLASIDAPEKTQDYGTESRNELRKLLGSRIVTLLLNDQVCDKYGRVLAELFTEDLNVNLEMVKRGAAHVYDKYCSSLEYVKTETAARKNVVGLWRGTKVIAPWEFRKTFS